MGIELTLFIVVGALSVFAAVMMLISENAVHSALFLILNFAAVAFMYLMMDAPFLAMVQVTVYAGAIMVLFLFVIMLLGAEKLLPSTDQRYGWITSASVAVIVTILLIASIAILQSEIDETQPEAAHPILRVMNANSTFNNVDVYLGAEKIANELDYNQGSEYVEQVEGEYTLRILPHNADPTTTEPLLSEEISLNGNDVVVYVVLPQAINDRSLLRVSTSLTALDDHNTSTLTIINAIPCVQGTVCVVDVADTSDSGKDPFIVVETLDYANVATTLTLRRDFYTNHRYTFGVYAAGEIEAAYGVESEDPPNLKPLLDHEIEVNDNHSYLWVLTADTRASVVQMRDVLFDDDNFAAFGSAEAVGKNLYTTYMLAVQAIAVLLLAAMVGTIILTKESEIVRRRNVRRMAAIPGTPTVEAYVRAMKMGEPLPPPTEHPQLPSSSGD